MHLDRIAKSRNPLAPDGSGCGARTRGVLQRASVLSGQQHFVGKETDRRWEFGDDLSVLQSKALEKRSVAASGCATRHFSGCSLRFSNEQTEKVSVGHYILDNLYREPPELRNFSNRSRDLRRNYLRST